MKYALDDRQAGYASTGERHFGDDTVLLDAAVDLTAATAWHADGYTVAPLFDPTSTSAFTDAAGALLRSLWREAGLAVHDAFALEHYHGLADDDALHLGAVERTKVVPTERFPVPIGELVARISQICKAELVARNPWDGQSVFHFRVVRPGARDNNPLHRDVWLEDYDDCINLYIPVAGSDARSSLSLIPGSHLWPESRVERTLEGARIGERTFNVPAVTAIDGDYRVVRPDPRAGEVLVFSPYLIHGGAANHNPDRTRISIELRLWKVPDS